MKKRSAKDVYHPPGSQLIILTNGNRRVLARVSSLINSSPRSRENWVEEWFERVQRECFMPMGVGALTLYHPWRE